MAWLLRWVYPYQAAGWLAGADASLVGGQLPSRFLVSGWVRADPLGLMLPPGDVVLQAGGWSAIDRRVR